MKIQIIAVGKLKEKFWVAACDEYLKRLKGYAKVAVTEVPDRDPAKVGGEEAAKTAEGKSILAALPERAHVVLLDVAGPQISSEELAARIDDLGISGESDVAFVIGGSCGVSSEVYARADERISLGRITLPHNLARVVILEQIYRAFKIIKHEPYHK